MEYTNKLILVEKKLEDKVAIVTLNNPPLNLVTLELTAELRETLVKLEKDDEVRVLVMRGSGTRAFCVGSDLKEFPQVADDAVGKKLHNEVDTFNMIEFLEKPVIAAMEGTACGGGFEIALACDIRILSEDGQIAQPEVKRGVISGGGGFSRLPKLVGMAKALEIMYLGEFIPASECLSLGLVNKLAPAGKALDAALEMARKIAAQPFESIRIIKKGVHEIGFMNPTESFYKSLEYYKYIFRTPDCKEGVDSFFEKRPPKFQ